jgi:hypothetical protein
MVSNFLIDVPCRSGFILSILSINLLTSKPYCCLYELDKKEPALVELAKIVRGADTDNRKLTPYSEGLAAIAAGLSITSKDDYDNMTSNSHCMMHFFGFYTTKRSY